MGGAARTVAQDDATPTDDEFELEGVIFEPLAFGDVEGAGLGLIRLTIDPGAIFPSEADDPSSATVYVESGTLTVKMEAAMTVYRAGALDVFLASPEAEDAEVPSEEIPAGQEFQLAVGDSTFFPANTGGEFRNDGTEAVVLLAALYEPGGEGDEATPES